MRIPALPARQHGRARLVRTLIVLLFLLVTSLVGPVAAQHVSDARNVFPVWAPADPNNAAAWNLAWLYGDVYLQRQVEASVASSSLDPNHRLTCFIDYSSIDVGTDLGAGDRLARNQAPGVLGKAPALNARRGERKLPASFAGSCANGVTCEGWIRCSWTEDGGITNTPFFLPGAPWDTSALAQQMPYYARVQGTTDPVVLAGPNGVFHTLYVAFTRDDINFLVDAVFRDANTNEPGKHALRLERVTSLASGNNSKWGQLHDKEAGLLRPCGTSSSGVPPVPCPAGASHRLDVAYTLFTGNLTGKFQAQIYVATSFDEGKTFTTAKVSSSVNEITGVALTGGKDGSLFAFFRDFSASPVMYMVREMGGVPPRAKWTSPVSILDAGAPVLHGYNQVAWKISHAEPFANLAPRSIGFATAATAPDGTVLVAWQECVDRTAASNSQRPLSCENANASPRIVLTSLQRTASAYATTWTARKAVDVAVRQPEENGQGFFSAIGRDNWSAHPQLLPMLGCGREGCLLTYFESRTSELSPNAPRQIGGYDRLMDLRGVRLNSNGTISGRSFQISKYPYRPGTTLRQQGTSVLRPETVNDIAMINEVCTVTSPGADPECECLGASDASPPLPGLTAGCIPHLNYYCRPQTGAGTTCFMGDYNGLVATTQWVGSKAAIDTTLDPKDVPGGFLSVSSTNQNLLPPNDLPWLDQYKYFGAPYYEPGLQLQPCSASGTGSRNTDVVMSQVTFGLEVVPSVTAKRTPDDGCTTNPATGVTTCTLYSFPFEIRNNTAQLMNAYVAIDYGDGVEPPADNLKASFSKTALVTTNLLDASGNRIPIPINPASSAVRVVYAKTTTPVRVTVTTDDPSLTARVWFNTLSGGTATTTDPTPTLTVTDPVTLSPDTLSPDTLSPDTLSPDTLSPDTLSPDTLSPDTLSPDTLSPDTSGVQETVWVITSSGDPTKSFQAIPYVDRSYSPYYFFQMQIYKVTPTGPCLDRSGRVTTAYTGSLVANTGSVNLSPDTLSPDTLSPDALAMADAFPVGTVQNNIFFTSKPRKRMALAFDPSNPATFMPCTLSEDKPARIGECLGLEAPPPPRQIVAVKLKATRKTDAAGVPIPLPPGTAPYTPVQQPPSMTVAEYWCEEGCTVVRKGPDLVVASETAAVWPTSVRAGQTVTFPTEPVTITNVGDQASGPYRIGYYLANAPCASLKRTADGRIDTDVTGENYARLLTVNGGGEAVAVKPALPVFVTPGGVTDAVDPMSALRIPTTVPAYDSDYYVCAYVDDYRAVSELDENNNMVQGGPIRVLAPGYGFLGLQTPCSGMTCDKTGTMPLAWQFTVGTVPVDSVTALPRLKWWTGCPADISGAPRVASEPNPADLTSGSSGWQYFPNTGISRPQYTWQFNFDATGLPRGQCYTMWIEIPSTGQVIGSTDPALQPFGPFSITPR